MKPTKLLHLLTVCTLLASTTACGDTDTETAVAESGESSATEGEPSGNQTGGTAPQSRFSEAMQIPVDGTSLEAFNESLAVIEKQAGKTEYTTLTNAIGFLLVYDLAAKRDRAKLAAILDGMTGEQIINLMEERRGEK